MCKKRILYRKAYYLKRRNMRKISSCLRLLRALLIIVPCIVFLTNLAKPALKEAALHSIRDNVYMVVKEAIEAEGVSHETPESFAADINRYLDERFEKPDSIDIGTPAGNIAGFGLLYGRGPVVKAHIVLISKAEVNCMYEEYSEEDEAAGGGNDATIQISINVRYSGLLISGSTTLDYCARYLSGSTGELLTSTSK